LHEALRVFLAQRFVIRTGRQRRIPASARVSAGFLFG
jgi:hypothetical protein